MKTLILSITAFILTLNLSSQISLENTYVGSDPTVSTSISEVNLNVSGYKYILHEAGNNEIKLYNPNHSLWKTVQLDIPAGYQMGSLSRVSEKLIDLDNELEFIYSYYDNSTSPVTYETRIMNEDGSILLTIPNCNFAWPFDMGPDGWKLRAPIYDGTNYSVEIYSLPGELSNLSTGGNTVAYYESNSKMVYPNPSSTVVNIPYELDNSSGNATMTVYSNNGTIVDKFIIDENFDHLKLNILNYSSGSYSFSIEQNGISLKSGQFIKQ